MAINKNHLFDELNGTKCAIVESGVLADRILFLRTLLQYNGYTVVVVETPIAKTAAAPKAEGAEPIETTVSITPTYTIGVTDVMFNATNAIFGRQLKTADGHIVTLSYWHQKDKYSNDEIPYYETNK